jgi:beta-mannanase
MYYPGDDYVDIVGLDVYVDDPVFIFFKIYLY